jgi:transposase
VKETPAMQRLMTLPGVGPILSIVITLELGTIERFATAENFAGYCGLVPRVIATGGRVRFGRAVQQSNQYLKWAFVEAADAIALNQGHWPEKHVVKLYRRIRSRRGHGTAAVAVGRHLAEAAYWMLKKGEDYREPPGREVSSTHG